MIIALLTAGGTGDRMGQHIPKQFLTVYDKPIIVYTLEAFEKHSLIDEIYVSCLEGWENFLLAYCKQFKITKLKKIVYGGKNNMFSIRNGLSAVNARDDDIILIHDGNRALVSERIITDCIETVKKYGNATPFLPLREGVFETRDGLSSNVSVPIDNLLRIQTPNGFYHKNIMRIHEKAEQKGITESKASTTLTVEVGETAYFYTGEEMNFKLTTTEDLEIFRAILSSKGLIK